MRRFPVVSRGIFEALPVAGLVLAVLGWATLAGPAAATPYDYVAGHGDIGLSYDSGSDTLRIYLNFDNSSVVQDANGNPLTSAELNALQSPAGTPEWPLSQFRVVVPATQRVLREPGATWDFVGVGEGEPYWELPEFLTPDVPYFGFLRRPSGLADATFTLGDVLLAPEGGIISAWQYVGGEPDLGSGRYWSSAPRSTPSPSAITLAQNHQHYNFGFSQAGLYQFEIIGSTSATGQTATGVLTVNVVPEPSSAALGVGLAVAAAWRLGRRKNPLESRIP